MQANKQTRTSTQTHTHTPPPPPPTHPPTHTHTHTHTHTNDVGFLRSIRDWLVCVIATCVGAQNGLTARCVVHYFRYRIVFFPRVPNLVMNRTPTAAPCVSKRAPAIVPQSFVPSYRWKTPSNVLTGPHCSPPRHSVVRIWDSRVHCLHMHASMFHTIEVDEASLYMGTLVRVMCHFESDLHVDKLFGRHVE